MSTYQQLLYHIVFSTKGRRPYLKNTAFRENVFAYMAGTAKELEGYAVKINGYFDHAHLLVHIPARLAVSKFVGQLKANTSKHINGINKSIRKFGWQDGFGVFTVSASQQEKVEQYIANQMEHHSVQSFEDEYIQMLNKHNVSYDPRYVFD